MDGCACCLLGGICDIIMAPVRVASLSGLQKDDENTFFFFLTNENSHNIRHKESDI